MRPKLSLARYGAILGVTLVAALWSLVVAFAMAWGGADWTAASMALLALGMVAATVFGAGALRRAPVVWMLMLAVVASAFQVVACVGVLLEIYVEEEEDRTPLFFLPFGITPVVVALAILALGATRQPVAGVQPGFGLTAFVVLGLGTFVVWLLGFALDEGVSDPIDSALYAFLTMGPVALYSLAGAIVASVSDGFAPATGMNELGAEPIIDH